MNEQARASRPHLDLARVLVVDDNPAARLTLQTVLEASGYRVDAAASAAEAVEKLEGKVYELVLSDMQMESPQAGLKVLAHAQIMQYKPATALITTTYQDSNSDLGTDTSVLIAPEDVPSLLETVAGLIARRASRLINRGLRQSKN